MVARVPQQLPSDSRDSRSHPQRRSSATGTGCEDQNSRGRGADISRVDAPLYPNQFCGARARLAKRSGRRQSGYRKKFETSSQCLPRMGRRVWRVASRETSPGDYRSSLAFAHYRCPLQRDYVSGRHVYNHRPDSCCVPGRGRRPDFDRLSFQRFGCCRFRLYLRYRGHRWNPPKFLYQAVVGGGPPGCRGDHNGRRSTLSRGGHDGAGGCPRTVARRAIAQDRCAAAKTARDSGHRGLIGDSGLDPTFATRAYLSLPPRPKRPPIWGYTRCPVEEPGAECLKPFLRLHRKSYRACAVFSAFSSSSSPADESRNFFPPQKTSLPSKLTAQTAVMTRSLTSVNRRSKNFNSSRSTLTVIKAAKTIRTATRALASASDSELKASVAIRVKAQKGPWMMIVATLRGRTVR